MLEGARIMVVVPAHCEQAWIAETVTTMPSFVDRILVVDDASSDLTGQEAERAGGERVEVLRHASRRGVGAAILTGYRKALKRGADVIAVMAGDGQMHPDDLRNVVLPIVRQQADYVKGDRVKHPSVFRTMPPARLAGTMVLAWLTRHAAGLASLSDSQCGYTAISAAAVEAILGEDIWQGYGYPNDVIGALARHGKRISEVQVRPIYRGEASGLRPWHLFTIGYVIARIAYRRLTEDDRRPSEHAMRSDPFDGQQLEPAE